MKAEGTTNRPDPGDELGIDGLSDVTAFGAGGSSTVYRATQRSLGRTVAVKVIHRSWSSETQERLERERQLLGRLSGHAEVVPILQTGITKRGEPYLLLPFYGKGSLARLLADHGALAPAEAGDLVLRAAEALADCHNLGVVHRDIKPGNILLTDRLRPRLSDFGISLPAGEPTSTPTVAYTPHYSPPEAQSPGVVQPTTDVFGLAATLWALLAGQPPRIKEGFRPPSVDTSNALAELLERSLDPEPSVRPADATAFGDQLRTALGETGALPGEKREALPAGSGAKLTWWWVALALGGLLLSFGLWQLYQG